ncbi:MAG: hypothetical protein R3Y19_07130, partial [Rikenellaceae bacterium]
MKQLLLSGVMIFILIFSTSPSAHARNDGGRVEKEITKLAIEGFVSEVKLNSIEGAQSTVQMEKLSRSLYRVSVTLDLAAQTRVAGGWSVELTPVFESQFNWAPQLTPSDRHIVSDHVWRSPAMIWASNDRELVLIPDLEQRAQSHNRWFMDMDVENGRIEIGMSDYYVAEHVLFHSADSTTFGEGESTLSFYLLVTRGKDILSNPFKSSRDFLWSTYGKESYDKYIKDRTSLDIYSKYTYDWAFRSWSNVYQEFELDGEIVGAPQFIITYTGSPNYDGAYDVREIPSIWNQAWFSSLRSAVGLYKYAKRMGDDFLMDKAIKTKELALLFPQVDGLFPAVVACEMQGETIDGQNVMSPLGWETHYFTNSNRNPYNRSQLKADSRSVPYQTNDLAITGYQMIRWYNECEGDQRLVDYCIATADKLLTYQDADGFFPTFIDFESQKPLDILAQSPTTALVSTFLLELYKVCGDERYKLAALRSLDAMILDIIPTGRWEDFETYWSCSWWGGDMVGRKIPRNNQYKQNTLSMYWAADALMDGYDATGDKRYLKNGERVLDELSMYQALWQPPYMYVDVMGGFGVMNADGEWLDARQSVIAPLFIEYGKKLNKREYIERGKAALVAAFNMMYCPENISREQWEKVYPF